MLRVAKCTVNPWLTKMNKHKNIPSLNKIISTLVGNLTVNKTDPQTWTTIEQKYSVIKDGGYVPENCTSRQKVAIIIPFRDRESHLRIFLNHMHAFLMKQQLEYAIYVIEQVNRHDLRYFKLFIFYLVYHYIGSSKH